MHSTKAKDVQIYTLSSDTFIPRIHIYIFNIIVNLTQIHSHRENLNDPRKSCRMEIRAYNSAKIAVRSLEIVLNHCNPRYNIIFVNAA